MDTGSVQGIPKICTPQEHILPEEEVVVNSFINNPHTRSEVSQ